MIEPAIGDGIIVKTESGYEVKAHGHHVSSHRYLDRAKLAAAKALKDTYKTPVWLENPDGKYSFLCYEGNYIEKANRRSHYGSIERVPTV